MRRLLLTGILLSCYILTIAQAPRQWTAAEMYQAIKKLDVVGSVLYVAAHPDDENTRLISYFSKEKLYRAGYLSLTRGDGGQNLIGDQQGIELGLIRTQELLAARRLDGGEQFFSRAYDFGYSKSPEETFSKWDREKILADVVWVIRKFQPDIIVTRFPTTGEGGHGHHTASAILANEAFTAAADPGRFPEQLSSVQPWQAKRILWNTFNFGGTVTITPDQFRVDVGGYNPLLGKSYGEIAAESRSQHKSQGFGVPSSRGEAFESFKTTGGTAPAKDLFDDVDVSWNRVPGGKQIHRQVNRLARNFNVRNPSASVPALVKLYTALMSLPEGHWKAQKMTEVKELIAQCSGLFMEAVSTQQYVVQTDSATINIVFNNRSGLKAVVEKIAVETYDTAFNQLLVANKNFSFQKKLFISASKPVTQPYWLRQPMKEGYFDVQDQQLIGQPDVHPAFEVTASVRIQGGLFDFTFPVKYKYTDPVRGEIYQPVVVVPPVTLTIDPPVAVATQGVHFTRTLTSNKADNLVVTRSLFGPMDSLRMNKGEVDVKEVNPPTDPLALVRTRIDSFYDARTGKILLDLRSINYDHIPSINYFVPAAQVSHGLALARGDVRRIGYITGAGDKVPQALQRSGYEVTLLSEKDIAANHLSQYDAIITGVRAYNTNAWLTKYHTRLMQYVHEGGNLVVQYNTNSNAGPLRATIGPWPFDISRNRVTDENAAPVFTQPGHQVLNWPNKITADDFNDWIQERSIYHAANWDKQYETVLAFSDPGEKPDAGSLLIGRYGKGTFTYTGLVFFRELPAGVTGSYKLLANILALNKKAQ